MDFRMKWNEVKKTSWVFGYVCLDCIDFAHYHIWLYKKLENRIFGSCYNCGLDMTHWNINEPVRLE